MKLHRFYVKEKINKNDEQSESFLENRPILKLSSPCSTDLIHQWKHVFRFMTGAEVILFDNSGFEYRAVFHSLKASEAALEILEISDKRDENKNIWLFASIIKKDNFEWIVEKATELGINGIVPILSDRSEKKSLNIDRLNRIVVEASEQSGRVILPELKPIMSLEEAFVFSSGINLKEIVFEPKGKNFKEVINEKNKVDNLAIFIGPEGGWTERELDFFQTKNTPILSLGQQVLRAETAVVACLSIAIFS